MLEGGRAKRRSENQSGEGRRAVTDSQCVVTSLLCRWNVNSFFHNQSVSISEALNHIKGEIKSQLVPTFPFFFIANLLLLLLLFVVAPPSFVRSCYERKIGSVARGKQIDSNVATTAAVKLSLEEEETERRLKIVNKVFFLYLLQLLLRVEELCHAAD